jgi:hypothetical protein
MPGAGRVAHGFSFSSTGLAALIPGCISHSVETPNLSLIKATLNVWAS